MKILVFDDTKLHRDVAKVQLTGHDLTIVGTYDEAEAALTSSEFDVVLTDLMVPPSEKWYQSHGREYDATPMPLGSIIALLALSKGTKKVGVVTETSHHSHPASMAIEHLATANTGFKVLADTNPCEWFDPATLEIVSLDFVYETPAGKEKYPNKTKDLCLAKDWSKALDSLLS